MNRQKTYIIILVIFVVSILFLKFERAVNRELITDYFNYYTTDYKKSLQELGQQYNIQIIYNVGSDFLTKEAQQPPKNGKAPQIECFEIARFARLLPQILQQYPMKLISTNISAIKLTKQLVFYGVKYGASYTGDVIYLSNNGYGNGFTDFYIQQSFHHEFSSLLMRNYNFPVQKWLDANKPGFQYTIDFESVIASIDEDTDLGGEIQYYQNGVIAKYSYTTYENDFNLFAQMVFNEPERLKELVKKYPIIKKKYLIVKEFYLSISPFFAETFRKIL